MSLLDITIANLAPGVQMHRELAGRYSPRKGLAIYLLPTPDYTPSAPGMVLGEALAARSGLGCTMLEGVPVKIPEGAVVVGLEKELRDIRPDLMEMVPEMRDPGQYAIVFGKSALVAAPSPEGLAYGMQTLSMIVLRHAEATIPGSILVDKPQFQARGLAIELQTHEITVNLLMQILSFAATFKANRLHLILAGDFTPGMEIPGLDVFVQTCHSYGMALGVRVPWLGNILSGARSIADAWLKARSLARMFGAAQIVLDDPCPEDADRVMAKRLAASLVRGDPGVAEIAVDGALPGLADYPESDLKAAGVTGWFRMADSAATPGPSLWRMPLLLDVESPTPGFSAGTAADFHARLNAAVEWLWDRPRQAMFVSFRDIGVSHMWQNLLFPAATGLIAAWGKPKKAEDSFRLFANLLYGDSADAVAAAWDAVGRAFPTGLSRADERLVRRTMFGQWPEAGSARSLLKRIDWAGVAGRIRTAAAFLKTAVDTLSRNASTLAGAKLALQALSWLHCFSILMPELERRRKFGYDADGRTEPIAAELLNAFLGWQTQLEELAQGSGLEIAEMPQIESMGLRLKGLCDAIFEQG